MAASGDRVREVQKARGTDKHRISQESGDSPNICKTHAVTCIELALYNHMVPNVVQWSPFIPAGR